jgi:hypothetical protein
MLTATAADLGFWALVWVATATFLLLRHWRNDAGVGLLMTFVLSFGVIHWLAPALYLLPWYTTRSADLVAEGLRQSAWATVALAVGAEIVLWVSRQRQAARRLQGAGSGAIEARVVNLYLGAGALLYGVVFPIASGIPSLQALVATGSTVTVVAVGLKCWNGWQSGHRAQVWRWLAASAMLPLVTVVTQGFLGYGFAAMLTIFAFVASFYRPRWKVIAAAAALAYVGLSVYVTYMRDRVDIRAVVWGRANLGDRAAQLGSTFAEMEWFDIHDSSHLDRIDRRLDQDYLVGAAVAHIGRGSVPFARGATLVDAALGIVPRALWPNKPTVGGSGDLVSTYTGIRFAEGTSVGIGELMECYVNFGTPGVVVGFLVIGALLALVDRGAIRMLRSGNVRGFTLWYLPGLSLLQVGGSFVEITSTAAAGFAMALVLNYVIARLPHRNTPRSGSLPAVIVPRPEVPS